jgi:predicted negative regulator of RcsB-dependent stress response
MATYQTDEEQIDALRRWWNENGRSTIAAVVIALSAGFAWQAYQKNNLRQQEQASDIYQALLRTLSTQEAPGGSQAGIDLAEQLKSNYASTSYAQFAALHLAAMSVRAGKLPDAEAQLRWVLEKASNDSDVAKIAQLRLARVIAATGDTQQSLTILDKAEPGAYGASYAAARGDILLAANQRDAAREAYSLALELADSNAQGINLSTLQQKLQSLTPVASPAHEANPQAAATAAVPARGDSDVPKE